MKKTVLLFLMACVATVSSLSAQAPCVRDSSLLTNDTVFISPAPYTAANPVYRLNIACIGQPYSQSVTIKVPSTFVFQGITLGLTSASIATTGAVSGLPTGIGYSCDPPNCVFNANTLGCILLSGTPTNAAQAPDTLDLSIKAKVNTSFGPLDITFPGPIAPGNYYLVLRTAAGCMSEAVEPGSPFTAMQNTPNPFSGQTTFHVDSDVAGSFQFNVFDILGNRVHNQTVSLSAGANQFSFEAGTLPVGAYYYILGNRDGKVSGKMVITK
jgi:hypothetical protein